MAVRILIATGSSQNDLRRDPTVNVSIIVPTIRLIGASLSEGTHS
jgi:hypothetical protein